VSAQSSLPICCRPATCYATAPRTMSRWRSGRVALRAVEEVTWDNEVVWSHACLPYDSHLTHHDLEPLPNGNVLVLCWERKTKAQALQAGRRVELIPDGEVWNNLTLELEPNVAEGGASVVWRWSLWDHLVQDYDETKDNYVKDIADHPARFDINYCPPGAQAASIVTGSQLGLLQKALA
jgi:hypothetical protein